MTLQQPFTYKYKPKNLKDFHYDDEVINVIETFIDMSSLSLLLVGNSGSGKSSLIQSIIRKYYGFDISIMHDNILSINTLKEQGISYYRNEVKVFCQTASIIYGKKKIVLLDDLDVINEQSQQVFRNCIDKYSDNVAFIASCCNTQKVIDSIQSRMNIIKLKSPNMNQLKKIAEKIILHENIELRKKEVLDFICKVCNGSVRILVNYLEKFKLLDQTITLELASHACTNISYSELDKYTDFCQSNDLLKAIDVIDSLTIKGYAVTDILDSYFTYIKITDKIVEDKKYAIVPLLCKYITVFHDVHEDDIELKFFTNELITILTK